MKIVINLFENDMKVTGKTERKHDVLHRKVRSDKQIIDHLLASYH